MFRLALVLLVLLAGAYFYFFRGLTGFEKPNEGIFTGVGENAAVVIRPYGSERVFIWLAKIGGDPVEVKGIEPILLNEVVEVRGEVLSDSTYALEVYESGKLLEKIKLESSSVSIPLLTAEELSEIKLRLAKQLEFEKLQLLISQTEDIEKTEKTEIDKLTGFLSDGGLLRESSTRRLEREKALLAQIEREFNDAHSELRKMNRQVELAYRVTGMGKLVSLSRESLERERRWIGSLLKVNVPEVSEDVIKKSDEAIQVLELKRQIEAENSKIYELLNLGGGQ